MAYRVKAAAAVVKIGGSERYLYRGAIVPAAAANIEHLAEIGLLEKVALPEPPEADSPEDEQQAPEPVKETTAGDVAAPPKAGPGSSAEAWRAYAKNIGVEVDESADRAEVIAALETAGKPTE